MPHGVLFRGGAEGRIRECLIQRDQLDAVIGLPSNLFYSTTIPACLLIFHFAKPEDRRGTVLIVDGSNRFLKGRNQNQMRGIDVDAIVAAYRNRAGGGEVSARVVEHTEIKENGWDLNIGRYLKTEATESLGVPMALAALREAQDTLRAAEARLDERLRAAGYD
jgi:type I restriction enzyme M protein